MRINESIVCLVKVKSKQGNDIKFLTRGKTGFPKIDFSETDFFGHQLFLLPWLFLRNALFVPRKSEKPIGSFVRPVTMPFVNHASKPFWPPWTSLNLGAWSESVPRCGRGSSSSSTSKVSTEITPGFANVIY